MKLKSICNVLTMGVAAAIIGMAAPTDAIAQAAGDCACVVPIDPDGQPVGLMTGASGQVQISQAAGFAAGSAGTALLPGTQIIVGPQSSASISVGASCSLQIQQNSNVVLEALNGEICVRVRDLAGETAGTSNNNVAVGVLGLGAVGGVIALAVSSSDSVSD